MAFILMNWRWILFAALVASNVLTFKLWRSEVADFTAYKIEVAVLGKAAEAEKIRTEATHTKTTKEIEDAIPGKIAAARTNAVAAYRLRYPDAGCSCVPSPTNYTSRTDAKTKESLASTACDPNFVEDAAHDAVILDLWQTWARDIGFPVK